MSETGSDSYKKLAIVAIAIAAISLCCSIFVLTSTSKAAAPEATTTTEEVTETTVAIDPADKDMSDSDRYVLYIGTNDKDTYKMEMTQEEAKKRVDDILLSHFGGYTMHEASGYWVDEDGASTSEYTLVCTIDDPESADEVYAACDEIKEALNQNTILVEHATIKMQYYAGK
jgi:hypothetical protein